MSLNTAHAYGGVLIHAGESIMLFSDGVQMEFMGQDGEAFRGSKTGRIYLTTHRMIFTNKKANDPLVSFSFPFTSLNDIEVEQPIFGANFIKGKVRAQQGGSWVGEAKFKINFKKGGAIDFAQAMARAVTMAKRYGDMPPPYSAPSGPMYQAPPPAYTPSQEGYYGWNPPLHTFPEQPPPNSVYMTDQPPPYPGIGGYTGYASAPPPPQNGAVGFNVMPHMSSADAKAAEAAQTAYYDPNRPNTAYVPPPAYYQEAPPSYQDSNKKFQ